LPHGGGLILVRHAVRKTLIPLVLGLGSAALGLTALLYLFAAAFRPDVSTPLPPPDEAMLAELTASRRLPLNRENPPRLQVEVDYGQGATAPWWPKGESPLLAELVAEGRLPPVAERVGPEPVVLAGVEGIGRYGGTWQRLAASQNDVGTVHWRLSGSNLVRWSPEGYPVVPHVARAWEVSPDLREYTFHLRRGMRWSDGAPLTAADLEYWYEHEIRYFEATPRFLRNASGQGRLVRVDDYTVKFVFDEPNALFAERLASVGQIPSDYSEHLVPAHYLRQFHPELGNQDLIRRYLQAYQLSSPRALYQRMKQWSNPEHPRLWPWVPRTYTANPPYVFVRNPWYAAVDPAGNQLPYLDRLVMEIRPNTLIGLAASTGQASMQERFVRYEDHVLLLGEAERAGYRVFHWYHGSRSQFTVYPVINRRVDPERPETAWKHRLLNDRRFRQALSLALNRRDVIDALLNGQGEPAQIDPGPKSRFHSPELFRSYTEYDPGRANRLLDELGLTGRDSDGYRTFPDGTGMVWYLNMTEFTGNDPAQFVVDDWARVGVRAVQRQRARPLFYAEKVGFEHDFTVWTGESEAMPLVEPRNFVPTYFESHFAPGFGQWYLLGGLYGDPSANVPGAIPPPADHPLRRNMELLERIYQEGDARKREELFRRILEANTEEVWHISLSTSPPQLTVVKDGFRNVPPLAIMGAVWMTPANAGLETYFWDRPADSPAIVASVKRAMTEVEVEPVVARVRGGEEASAVAVATAPPSLLGRVLRLLVIGSAVAAALLVAFRHPFVGRRLLLMVPTLAVVSVIIFVIVQLPPGDFANSRKLELEMQGTAGSAQAIADLRADFHLDEPMPVRYLRWVGLYWFTSFRPEDAGLLQGNLGLSMEHNRSVNSVVGDRLLLTVVVSLATLLFTWALALPMGIFSAVRQYSIMDYVLTFIGFLGMSVPGFLLAIVLMYLANQWFGVSVSGLFSPEYASTAEWSWGKVADLLTHVWVPVVVLGFGGTAGMIRVMRANLLDELRKPYVTTARAKGVRPVRLLFKYPVRLALNPFISGLGALFPQLVSGGAIVALVLSLPMVGPVMLDALLAEDVYLAGSMLMVMSVLGVFGTLVSDLLLLWLDPRIRLGGGGQ
jgi:ABC-type dipeptide/oligopeptide/nickel transport system permease component/ABC-type transport system substrate-binding protein